MNELKGMVTMQDILLNLNEENLEVSLNYLKDSYFSSFNKFDLLLNIIFEISNKKRNLRFYLVILCKNFSDSRKNLKKRSDFKHFFLSKFLTFDTSELNQIHSHIHFYFLSVECRFITEEELFDLMQTKCNTEIAASSPCIIYFLLLYFAPQLKEKKNDFYLWLCSQFEHNIKKVTEFSKSLLRHWGRLPERLLFISSFIIENQSKIMEKEKWTDRKSVLKKGAFY